MAKPGLRLNLASFKYGEHEIQLAKSQHKMAMYFETDALSKAEISALHTKALASLKPFSISLKGFCSDWMLLNYDVKDGRLLDEIMDEIRMPELKETIGFEYCSHTYHTSGDGVSFIPDGRIFIRFRKAASPEEIEALLKEYELTKVRETENPHNEWIVKISEAAWNPIKVVQDIYNAIENKNINIVEVVEPCLYSPISNCMPSDRPSLRSLQWYLDKNKEKIITEPSPQSLPSLPKKVTIAIIDDGFDIMHPDLIGKDRDGIDFAKHPACAVNSNSSQNVIDSFKAQHGTACASLAVGEGGITGVAPHCQYMPIRHLGFINSLDATEWFRHALANDADVILCAWEPMAKVYPLSTPELEALEDCLTKGRGGRGMVICFAAGNKSSSLDIVVQNGFLRKTGIIVAGGYTHKETIPHYANFGSQIDIAGPASGNDRYIPAAAISGTGIGLEHNAKGEIIYSGNNKNYNLHFGGTSAAAALIAGYCAALIAQKPSRTSEQVGHMIITRAKKKPSPSLYDEDGRCNDFGYGFIDFADIS